MRLLEDVGILRQGDSGGYAIADVEAAKKISLEAPATDPDEDIYLSIADDRVNGRLPWKITESEFLPRYELTKGQLSKILWRMTNEGWIERPPGNGWLFLRHLADLSRLKTIARELRT